jgi:hypothetical protein
LQVVSMKVQAKECYKNHQSHRSHLSLTLCQMDCRVGCSQPEGIGGGKERLGQNSLSPNVATHGHRWMLWQTAWRWFTSIAVEIHIDFIHRQPFRPSTPPIYATSNPIFSMTKKRSPLRYHPNYGDDGIY